MLSHSPAMASDRPGRREGEDLRVLERACRAAETACKRYGQWVPHQWLDLFMDAYGEPAALTPETAR